VITHDEDFVELLGRSDYVDEFFKVSKNDLYVELSVNIFSNIFLYSCLFLINLQFNVNLMGICLVFTVLLIYDHYELAVVNADFSHILMKIGCC